MIYGSDVTAENCREGGGEQPGAFRRIRGEFLVLAEIGIEGQAITSFSFPLRPISRCATLFDFDVPRCCATTKIGT